MPRERGEVHQGQDETAGSRQHRAGSRHWISSLLLDPAATAIPGGAELLHPVAPCRCNRRRETARRHSSPQAQGEGRVEAGGEGRPGGREGKVEEEMKRENGR